MIAITRGRAIIGAGFLATATLLGTALAAGPAMTHEGKPAMTQEGHSAMTQEGAPGMTQEGTLASLQKVRPAPEEDASLIGMTSDALPTAISPE